MYVGETVAEQSFCVFILLDNWHMMSEKHVAQCPMRGGVV